MIPEWETYDVFQKYMEWGQLVFDSNPEDIQKWVATIAGNPNSLKILKSILFHGFSGLDDQKHCEEIMQLHPANIKVSEEDDDTSDAENEKMDLCTIGQDLGVYMCQYLDLFDLISLESTSRYFMKIARHPSALYSMHIVPFRMPNASPGVGLRCEKRNSKCSKFVLEIASLSILGKCRFANLRRLAICLPMTNMRWNRLLDLDVRVVGAQIQKQSNLEHLRCNYNQFIEFGDAFIYNAATLTTLSVMFRDGQQTPIMDVTPRFLPALKYLTLEGMEWLTWTFAYSFIKTLQFIHLTGLDITVYIYIEDDDIMVESQLAELLSKCDQLTLYLNSKRNNLCPNIMNLLSKHGACQKVEIFINMDIHYVFGEAETDALLDWENEEETENVDDFWSKSFWPNPIATAGKHTAIKLTLSISASFPYSPTQARETSPGVYDMDKLSCKMSEKLAHRYRRYKSFSLIWNVVEVATNVGEEHDFDVWCEFYVES